MRGLLLGLLAVWLVSCGGSDLAAELPLFEEEVSLNSGIKMATQNAAGDVAAEAGYIADGAEITLPAGFTATQCVFTASLASVGGKALSSRVSVNRTTGEVTCKAVVQEREQVPPVEKSCSASYMVVCAK